MRRGFNTSLIISVMFICCSFLCDALGRRDEAIASTVIAAVWCGIAVLELRAERRKESKSKND